MGADNAQTLKAIREAEAYDGPSLIIAYSPCINHGLKAGMGRAQEEERKAVECGYWHLWRYNPVRFASLFKMQPEAAGELFQAAQDNARWRYNNYKRLSQQSWGNDPELTKTEEELRK